MLLSTLLSVLTLIPAFHPGASKDNPEKAPSEAKSGKVFQWKAEDDLPFEFFIPKNYDAEKGANLTLVLHGNGLDHRWTFWNHPAGEFRPDDIVVSPDGTTYSSGTGANEFLGNKKDADRIHALIEELKQVWNVRQVFLYGHSQGSFFVFYYAGLYPEDVDGVCGHASGVWNGTKMGKKGHHHAIGFLHGTNDHIPYGQSLYGAQEYGKAKYEHVLLRTLFDWDHRPHHFQAESVLAWAEGVTSDDPERVALCLEELSQPKLAMGANWSGLYAVAARLAEMEGASQEQRDRGARAVASIDELAQTFADEIEKGLGKKGKLSPISKGDHIGLLIRLLAEFEGVPARESFAETHKRVIESLQETGAKAYGDYYKAKDKDPKKAFTAGLKMLEEGYLHYRCPSLLEPMDAWAKDKKLGLSKKSVKAYQAAAKAFEAGREDGFKDFAKRTAKVKL